MGTHTPHQQATMCCSCECCGTILKPMAVLLALCSLAPLILGIVSISNFTEYNPQCVFAYLLISVGGMTCLSGSCGFVGAQVKTACCVFFSLAFWVIALFAQVPTLYFLYKSSDATIDSHHNTTGNPQVVQKYEKEYLTLSKHRKLAQTVNLGFLALQLLFGMVLYFYYTSFKDADDRDYEMNLKHKSYQRIEDKQRARSADATGFSDRGVKRADNDKESQRADLYSKYPELRHKDREATRMTAKHRKDNEGGDCCIS